MDSVWRQTGVKPADYEEEPVLPDICKDVWIAFVRLQNSKVDTAEGFTPITFSEILAYSQLYEIKFDDWELHLLHIFDGIARELTIKQLKEEQAKHKTRKR